MRPFSDLFTTDISVLEFMTRGAVVFGFVLFLLRISGKRQIGQLSPTEFVALLLISNAVQNAMNGGDNSLSGGLVLAATIVFISWLISYFSFKNKHFRNIVVGRPTILVHDGKSIEANLEKELLTQNDLTTLLRKQGLHSCVDIKTAILESDGSLSIFKKSET